MSRFYDPLHSFDRFGPFETAFCRDKGEWVNVDEECVKCDKYAKWDGVNFQCRDRFEWERDVDENFEREGISEYTGYRISPREEDDRIYPEIEQEDDEELDLEDQEDFDEEDEEDFEEEDEGEQDEFEDEEDNPEDEIGSSRLRGTNIPII